MSKMISCRPTQQPKSITFDIMLAIALPLLCILAWPAPVPFAVFLFLVICHIVIAIYRYIYNREIVWPIWADILAALTGAILVISAFIPMQEWYTTVIYIAVGLFIMFGHIKKICYPNKPYYYGTAVPTSSTPADNLFF